jgi:hypothetical protein
LKIPKLELGQVVALLWVDINSALGWCYNPKKPRVLAKIASIGYVVQCNKESLTITTSMDARGATIDDLSIPLGCIRQLEILANCGMLKRKEAHGEPVPVQNPAVQDLQGAQGGAPLLNL